MTEKSRFYNFLYPNHHNIRPYYQNHVSIFFTDDHSPDTFCTKGWKCTFLDRSHVFSCSCTIGNFNVVTGKLSSIINLRGFLLEEFSRHINFSEQYLCRGISIAFIFSHPSFLLPSYKSITEEPNEDMSNSIIYRNKRLLHKNHNVSTSWLIV